MKDYIVTVEIKATGRFIHYVRAENKEDAKKEAAKQAHLEEDITNLKDMDDVTITPVGCEEET